MPSTGREMSSPGMALGPSREVPFPVRERCHQGRTPPREMSSLLQGRTIGSQPQLLTSPEKVKKKDPRGLPAHALTLDTFELKYPFVKVCDIRHMTEMEDKFGPNYDMDAQALQAFIHHLGPSLDTLYDTFASSQGQELNTRPIHAGFCHKIRKLADATLEMKESIKKREDNEPDEAKGDNEFEGMKVEFVATDIEVEEEEEEEEQEEGAEDVATSTSTSSRGGMHVGHEVRISSGFADLVLSGYDKGYTKMHNLPSKDPSALRPFMILEPKGPNIQKIWKGGVGGASQGGAYCVDKAMSNFKTKGIMSPIYLQGWSMRQWCYGVLVIEDVIKLSWDGIGRTIESHLPDQRCPNLQSHLNIRESKLRKYVGDSDLFYDPGDYLVGKLYLSDEVLLFPYRDKVSRDAIRFFEGMLRVCLGDKILIWTKEDVASILSAVQQAKRRKREDLEVDMVGFTARYEAYHSAKRLSKMPVSASGGWKKVSSG